MNVLVPYSWLKDYLQTSASAEETAHALSLCGPSVERVHHLASEEVLEVEVTQNRSDLLSIQGLAREAAVILPQFGHQTRCTPLSTHGLKEQGKLSLSLKIAQKGLCSRFSAIILDNVVIKPSPKVVADRLNLVGTRALNNVIDVTNYLMFDLGQPMHVFDYDKIKGHKMTLRESKEGEEITTLDNVKRKLPKGAIVIEDGEGRLIDLCGIMGGKNSEIDEETKRVLLFVQEYDPVRIRKTCQILAHRTEAAARFEKGIDSQGIIPALSKAVEMLQKNANAKVASSLIDVIENPYKPKTILCDFGKINEVIGIEVPPESALKILISLGFKPIRPISPIRPIRLEVPSWRYDDINIIEDLAEEVARIHGYFKLPANLPASTNPPTTTASQEEERSFALEQAARLYLKHLAFFECLTLSAASGETLSLGNLGNVGSLKIRNPLSKDFEYLRPSLVPQLLEVVKLNQPNFEEIRIFELSNVYEPKGETELPREYPRLTAIVKAKNEDFFSIKGIVEGLFCELGLSNYDFVSPPNLPNHPDLPYFPQPLAEIRTSTNKIGAILKSEEAFLFDLNFALLTKCASSQKTYKPIPNLPPILEDITIEIPQNVPVGPISKFLTQLTFPNIELLAKFKEVYEDTVSNTRAITFNLSYQPKTKPLNESEISTTREKIIKALETTFPVKIKRKLI